ncbi:MAG: N-acetylmuramoyl-L-alanine amidase [Bacteroidales bacterium]
MKRRSLIFGIFCLLLVSPETGQAQQKLNKVVIDAGHGGKDPGALGKYTKEKDIALSIALKTGEYIEKYLPDVDVVYTRKDDRFVELHRRAQIANESGADLFISIHCNAIGRTSIWGTETYVMGLHKSQANLEVAKAENKAILKEENYGDIYDGFDPQNDEDYITLSLFQNAFLDQSTKLASKVEDQFKNRVRRKSHGVKQAGFWVLFKTAMPGVLIETGFLTNASEERFLASEEGQVYIASAIYRAFKEYKYELENGETASLPPAMNTKKQENTPAGREVIFKVQFASSAEQKNLSKFRDLESVGFYKHNGIYKYTAGNLRSLDEAIKLQNKIRKKRKYKDAFVVAFQDGERIPVNKARSILND